MATFMYMWRNATTTTNTTTTTEATTTTSNNNKLAAINDFRHSKFGKMHGVCDHHLQPLLTSQVQKTIKAKRGDLELDMLIPCGKGQRRQGGQRDGGEVCG